ncbi:MAG: ROK family protein [Planctomycetota bacterium]|nr:MAG: ROK family protein [Planctomycetota bacterium]
MITLACDFGGRRIKLGVVRDRTLVAQTVLPARADLPLVERLPDVSRGLRELCASQELDPASAAGIGVSYPSVIDPRSGSPVDHFGKYGDVRWVDLQAWAQAEFGLPLALENDARAALIGEWQYGAGRGCDNVVIMTLGTGIGTAAVIEGRLLVGVHGQAGILGGHLTVMQQGRQCICGNCGCAEAEASTSVLDQLARQLPGFADSLLARYATISYEQVFRGENDRVSRQLAELSLRVWCTLAVNLIHAYDPEVLILGGGVMGSGEVIQPVIARYVEAHAHTPWGAVAVVASQLGDSAALLAAEWILSQRIQRGVRG